MASNPNTPPGARRSPKNLTKLNRCPIVGRFAVVSHFNKKFDKLTKDSRFPRLAAFLPQNVLPWVWNYLKFAFTRKFRFPSYGQNGNRGVYRLLPSTPSAPIRIAIAGDWGTGTDEAYIIATLMCHGQPGSMPDFTIHLGDIYYVGDEDEINENCLGQPTSSYLGVKWPHGTQGSFALNANHEMYANGRGYFTTFLPTLGISGSPDGQRCSFFSLESDQWRILGIDTGYNSVGIPILSQIPGLKEVPAIGGNCRLEDSLRRWLRDVVKPKENLKATLLLSHHQYFTAFCDLAYTKPAKQLLEFFPNQELVWIWGHEHRLAIYDKYKMSGGITAYGRCLGHGGMPVELTPPVHQEVPLLYYDQRPYKLLDGRQVGVNGFVNLSLSGRVLTLDYRDINNKSLIVEEFKHVGDGVLSHNFVKEPQPGLTPAKWTALGGVGVLGSVLCRMTRMK